MKCSTSCGGARNSTFWANPGITQIDDRSQLQRVGGAHAYSLLIGMEDEAVRYWALSLRTEELIYTAITRCRCNLCVINVNNEKFHEFFANTIQS